MVASVMRNERRIVHNSRRCDPCIGSFHAPSNSPGCDHHFCPFEDQIARRRNDHESCQKDPEPIIRLACQFDKSARCSNSASVIKEIRPLPAAGRWEGKPRSAVALKRNDTTSSRARRLSCRWIGVNVTSPFTQCSEEIVNGFLFSQSRPKGHMGRVEKRRVGPRSTRLWWGCPSREYF